MKRMFIYLLLTMAALLGPGGLAAERIVPSITRDIELMKEAAGAVDALGEEAASKLDKFIKKYEDSKNKTSVEEEIEGYKAELLSNESFRKAYRDLLHKEYKLTKEVIEKSGTADLKAVEKETLETISKDLNEKYPISRMQATKAKAAKAFPCYKVGDSVKVQVNKRMVSGRINSMSSSSVMIGSIRIPLSDLNPEFDPGKMAKLRSGYVREHYYEKRSVYQKQLYKIVPAQVHAQHGYVYYRDGWIAAKELAARIDATLETKKVEGEKRIARKAKMTSRLKTAAVIGGIAVVLLIVLAVMIRLVLGKPS